MYGQYRHSSETSFKWRFAGGPMMARLQRYSDPLSPHQIKKKTCKSLTASGYVLLEIFASTPKSEH